MRNKITLSGVLAFCLVIPFIMTYQIWPGPTNYFLFGIILALLLSYLVVGESRKIILWILVCIVVGFGLVSAIIVRHRTAPVYQVHDIILQQEAGIRFLLQGKNPYAMSYFNTPLEAWPYSDSEVNPALFHFVMMPGYLILALPFYFLSNSLFGYFDGRMPLLVLLFLILVLAWKLLRNNSEKQHLFLILLAFNPATLGYFREGRSDIFVFAFLFLAWYLLEKGRLSLAGIPLGVAFAVKQSAWPIFPLYLVYLWSKKKNLILMLKNLISLLISFSILTLPFFIWGPKSFLESTVFYLSGNTANSYPIAGYGWGMVLKDLGVIKDKFAYYPFWLWQLFFCGSLLVILGRWLLKKPEVYRLITYYGILTMVFWYFSRYFNNSHLGYLSLIFISAYFWPEK